MRYSDNYNLKLPQRGVDRANVDDLDDNFEIIDGALADDRQISLPMYDSTQSYNTGDIRGYENPTTHRIRAYRCLEDNVTGPWDATKWAQTTLAAEIENGGGGGGSSTLAGLSDVDLDTPADGEVLTYDATEGKWVNAAGGSGGASKLSDLDDVTLTTPTEGQILEFDGDEWVNADAPDVDVTKTASGNPIEVSDSANAPLVKCVTEIQGSQDLHGYDKPWVGGSGKNKLKPTATTTTIDGVTFTINADGSISTSGTSEQQITLQIGTITVVSGTEYFTSGCPVGGGANTFEFNIAGTGNDYGSGGSWVSTLSQEVTGRIRIQRGVDMSGKTFYPMIRVSGDSTYEPYSNICPITAYTEGEIEVRGKNLLESNATSQTKEGVTFVVNSDGSITANGTASAPFTIELQSYQKLSDYGITAEPYTISGKYGTGTAYLMLGVSGSGRDFRDTAGNGFSFTPTEAELDKNYRVVLVFANGAVLNNVTFYPMIEKGSTATTYEPYKGTTHITTYPSAIYRGSEDVVNGKVVTEKLVYTISDDTGIQGLTALTNVTRVIITINATQLKSSGTHISNYLKYIANYTLDAPHFYFDSNNRVIAFFPGVMTGDQWRAYIANNPLQIAYEVNPTTSSVTPTNLPIKSLSGYSHIESSTGDMEIEYITSKYSPITEVVSKQISTVEKLLELIITANREEEMKATQNYTAGDLLIVSGKLYKASSNIANGSTLVINSNVTSTTIAAELAALA